MSTTTSRRLKLALLTLAALAAVLLLGASIAVYLARGAIIAKAEAMAAGFGLSIDIREVDVPLMGGIGLRGVTVRRADGTPIAELERLETDVTLIAAAFGKRRPGRLDLVGGRVLVRWDDGPIDIVRAPTTATADAGPTEAIDVTFQGLDVAIEARHTTPVGLIQAQPIVLGQVSAKLTRDAQRNLSATASGTFKAGNHETAVTLAVDLATGAVELSAKDGIELGLETPYGPLWVALNGASRQPGAATHASGIGVRHGDKLLQIQAITLRGGGDTLMPDLTTITGFDAETIILQRGPDRTTIGAAAVTLAPSASGIAGLTPTHIALRDLEGTASQDGRRLAGNVGELTVGLDDVFGHLARNTPLDAITSLELGRPTATLTLPAAPAEPADDHLPPNGSANAAVNDEPPPFVGNDEDLPPAEAVVPVLAPGRDWLGALLGSDTDIPGPSTLIPDDIRARAPAILGRISALAPKISDGSLSVLDSHGKSLLALQGAGFSAAKHEAGYALDLRAAVSRDGKEAGRADLSLVITPELELDSLEGTLSGRSLAHQVARFVSGLSVQEDAEIDLTIHYTRPKAADAPHSVQGSVRLANFSFEYWRIADREIRDLEARATFDALIDRKGHRLVLTLPDIQVGSAKLAASLDLTKKRKHLPRFIARLEMPRQDCGAAAESIPKGLIPNLPTLKLRGQLGFKASLSLDLENPRGLDLEVESDSDDCEILSLGPEIDIEALRGPFIHHPREPKGLREDISVGRGTTEWVPSERIPSIVKTAAWVTEDRRWLEHKGVRWDLIERALKIDLEHGRFIYGGSTVTQQLVKNLYLTRTKNLARKFEEAIIAWQMERTLSKDEILTLYINCIEYGPSIYGIKEAARVYFGKKAQDLDALEAAFIMGLKPYPKAGYNQFLKQTLDVWWVRRVSHVLRYMAKFAPHEITLEQAEAFDPWQPAFRAP